MYTVKIESHWRQTQIIALFVERFSKEDIGGIKSYLRRLSKALKEQGKESIILTQKTAKNPEPEETIDGIKIIRLDNGDFIDRIQKFNDTPTTDKSALAQEIFNKNDIEETALLFAKNLHEFIKEYKPRAIHFHNSYFITPYALYFLRQNFQMNITPSYYFWSHSPITVLTLPDGSSSKLYDVLSSFQNEFEVIFAISKSVLNSMTKYGIKCKVKYLGVDTNIFQRRETPKQDFRGKLGISDNDFMILFTGRILREKGLDLLPELYTQLVNRNSKFEALHFVIAGDGKFKPELESLIAKQDLTDHFHFIRAENDDELVDIYSQADCFILPSRREALGLSLLEALSCSLPSIATDLPGIRELIVHTKNGILVSVDNQSEYIRWISGLYSNKNLREDLKIAARESVKDIFSFESHLNYFIRRLMK